MSIVITSIKLHSMVDVTSEFEGLNDCIIHKKKPTIWKKIIGKRKDIVYTVECSMKKEDEACGRCGEKENIVKIWNKYNPL